LRWLNPRLGEMIHNFEEVLVAELNMGQLRTVLRGKYLVDCKGLNKIQGKPFKVAEVVHAVRGLLGEIEAKAASKASA
jgi:2-oxoglutarate ferredoxin oxidoreductase subunit alpha